MRKWIAFAFVIVCVALAATVRVGPVFGPLKPSPDLPTFSQTFGYDPKVTDYQPAKLQEHVDCAYPGYPDGAQVVLLSAGRGLALPTASLGGQDVSTTVISVAVEPGEAPLYVIGATSRAVIWRFSGATGRIRRLVLASTHTVTSSEWGARIPMGETGVPRDNVTFLPDSKCLQAFEKASSPEASYDAERVKERVGHAPAVVAARDAVTRFSIPSGEVLATSMGDSAAGRELQKQRLLSFLSTDPLAGHPLEYDVMNTYPDGVMRIDPYDVIANVPVEPYDTLPGSAGLKQLVERGALLQVNADLYRILRFIRMPAETTGAHFTLMKGVPRPEGRYRGACVIDQDTGQPIHSRSDEEAPFPMPC